MLRLAIVVGLLALIAPLDAALGQTLNARRMGMGGVVLLGGGSDRLNVAYRAVPRRPGASVTLPLPIGLVPLLSDPPSFDPDDPDFNVYELANLAYNPPWNLQLVTPKTPSNDIVVELGRDHLAIQLGDVAELFPDQHSRFGAVAEIPALGVGVRQFFAGVSGVVHYHNDLSMNPTLRAVLVDGEPFQTNTDYALYDDAVGQAAAMAQFGWAGGVVGSFDPATFTGAALYAGVRGKLLRGLAYADAGNVVSFSTQDTLFSQSPISLDYTGEIRQTGPGGGGWGSGVDVGVAYVSRSLEMGIGLENLATRIGWRLEESVAHRDSANEDIVREVLRKDVPYTSELPITSTFNLALHLGPTTVAADVVRSMGNTVGHLGAEHWIGRLALRSGVGLDANRELQGAGGLGYRFGPLGLDLGVASHSRSLSHARGLELAASLSLYQ